MDILDRIETNKIIPFALATPVVAVVNLVGEATKDIVRIGTTKFVASQCVGNELCRKLMIDAVPDFPQGYFAAASMYALAGLFTTDNRKKDIFTWVATPLGLVGTELLSTPYWPDLIFESLGLLAFMLTIKALRKETPQEQLLENP
jgi:hypothetical protein